MKKLSKFIYSILAFALITCMAIFNPAISFVDAEASLPTDGNNVAFSSTKIAGTIKDGNEFKIPMPDVKNAIEGAQKFIEVKDRSGYTYTYEIGVAYSGSYFELYNSSDAITTEPSEVAYIKPAKIGRGSYTVRYKVVQGDKTYYSNSQTVQVEGVTYSWEFNKENTAKNIIPSVTASGTSYILLLPTIVNSDDEVAHEYTDASNIVITKNSEALTVNESPEFRFENGQVIFTPTLASGDDVTTYVIRYKSLEPSLADRTYIVKVESGYSNSAELEVKHNSITNVQIAANTTFPTPNVTDKTHNKSSVEVNTYITIKKGGQTVKELNPNEFNYVFETTGTYTIYYRVVDAYGNEATSAGYSISVNDRAPYIIEYAKDYDTSEPNWEDNVITGIDYAVPTQIGYSGFTLPAIYAKDYKDSYENLTFKRILENKDDSNEYYDLDKTGEHGNGALLEDNGFDAFSKSIYFEFPESDPSVHAGEVYKLKYSAVDSNGNEVFATQYEIKITNVDAEAYNIDKGLTIYFPGITQNLDPQSELSFTTATAKESPADDNLVADERVEVRTYYYYGSKDALDTALEQYIAEFKQSHENYNEKYAYQFDDFYASFNETNPLYELYSEDGKTSIKLEGYVNQKTVTIFAVGINDQQQFVVKAHEVGINNTTNDFVAPIIESVTDSYSTQLNGASKFNQNYTVTLPSVQFSDAEDDSLQVDITCYVDTPDQTVGVSIYEFMKNGIQLAKIDTTYAGTYYVTYTATDDAGNTTTYISTFEVAKTAKPHIEVENGSNISITVGEEVNFITNLVGDGEYEDVEYTISWGDNKPSGLGSGNNSFVFNKPGTYVATISAEYTMNEVTGIKVEPSVTVTIVVSEPTISWDSDTEALITTDRTADINERIELPIVYAEQNGEMLQAVPTVVRLGDDGEEIEVEVKLDEETFESYYFIADTNGVYTVTYTATSAYGTSTKSFNVTCGDYYEPTINIENNKLQDSEITYNGTDITFKVESFTQEEDENGVRLAGKYILKVSASEGDTKLFDYDIKVSFKDRDKDKNLVDLTTTDYSFSFSGPSQSSNGTNSWNITGVGTYELTITVEDENGNSTTKSISFNVVNKTESKKISDNVVGIILIAVSAVILGGVILFFALAGKRNNPRKRLTKSVKSDDKE